MHVHTDIALFKKTVSCILITQPYMLVGILNPFGPLSLIAWILLNIQSYHRKVD